MQFNTKLKQKRDTSIYNKNDRPFFVSITVENFNDNFTIITFNK
jgi:hypothetical protein